MKYLPILLALFVWLLVCPVFTQSALNDSLNQELKRLEGKERCDLLCRLAQQSSKIDPASSLGYAREAVALAQNLDDPLLLSNALNGLAIAYYYLGDSRQSLSFLMQSIDQLQVARRQDTSNLELLYRMALLSSNAGNVYKNLGQLDQSLEIFLRSEGFLDELMIKDPGNQRYLSQYISCMNNKALVYQDLREIEKAETALNEALTLSREMNFEKGMAMCLNNLGLIEIGKRAYEKALTIYTEALQINLQLQDSIAIAGTYNNFGLIHEETNSFRDALKYYKSSLNISDRLKYLFGSSNTSLNIGKIYGILHQFDSAEVYFDQGLIAAKKGDMLQLQQKGYQQMAEMFLAKKHYQKAFLAYREYSTIKDSIFTIERSKQIADMETKYETEKKVRENELLRKDLELRKTTQRLLFVALSAMIFVVFLLVMLARYKSRMLKQKTVLFEQEQKMQLLEVDKKELERQHFEDQVFAEKEINRLQQIKLEEQNRKLAAFALHVTTKNQILSGILEEISQAKKAGVVDPDACFRRIQQTVKSNLNLDKDWEQFKRHFTEVHPDFFIRLNEQYPTLTPGEQKICAYYRINMGTNEIAQILNVTIAGVQKSRHRLRKKLGIDSETDMADYMMRF